MVDTPYQSDRNFSLSQLRETFRCRLSTREYMNNKLKLKLDAGAFSMNHEKNSSFTLIFVLFRCNQVLPLILCCVNKLISQLIYIKASTFERILFLFFVITQLLLQVRHW